MAIPSLFQVATEFKFEIGSALLGTKALTNEVNKLSSAADNVIITFQNLGLGIAGTFGTGGAGVLGLIQKSISSAEKFVDIQSSFSTIINANRDVLTGGVDDFNVRLQASERLIKNISDTAHRFALDEIELATTTKLLMAPMLREGTGGVNFQNVVELSRQFGKTAPMLGFGASDSMNQLVSAIQGNATRQGLMFPRLTADTKAMREFANNTAKFNKLKPEKRVQLLTEALAEFSNSIPELNMRVNTVTGVIRRLHQVLAGINGILLPIGREIQRVLVLIGNEVIKVLNVQGRKIVNTFAGILRVVTSDLKGTIVTLMQLRDVSADMKRTKGAFEAGAIFLGLGWVLSKLTKTAWLLHPVIGAIGVSFYVLYQLFVRMQVPLDSIISALLMAIPVIAFSGMVALAAVTKFTAFGAKLASMAVIGGVVGKNLAIVSFVFKALGFVLTRILLPLTIIFGVFQLISRAVAIANIRDALALPELMAKIAPFVDRLRVAFGKLIKPFAMIFDFLAEKIAFLFQRTLILNTVLPLLDRFVGYIEALAQIVEDAAASTVGWYRVLERFVSGAWMRPGGESLSEAWRRGLDEIYKAPETGGIFGTTPASQQITNISGGVHINNQFKEQMQPDRIAFSIKEQLLKAAHNPVGSRNRSFTRTANAAAVR